MLEIPFLGKRILIAPLHIHSLASLFARADLPRAFEMLGVIIITFQYHQYLLRMCSGGGKV
jgi:hypothetical protein